MSISNEWNIANTQKEYEPQGVKPPRNRRKKQSLPPPSPESDTDTLYQ
jgi:hypothetical protein